MRLGDLLVNAGAISEKQLQSALMEQQLTNLRLGEILIKNGSLSEKQLAEALSSQLKLPMVTLARYRPMIEALRMVPENVAGGSTFSPWLYSTTTGFSSPWPTP